MKGARSEKNSLKGSLSFACIISAVIFLFVFTAGAYASQRVVYKAPKGVKEAASAASQKTVDAAVGPEEKIKVVSVVYSYDPTGKTDPFKSFIAEQESVEEKKKRKPKTYLETLDISQLDLIAIIVSAKGEWAMVRDAKGLGYVLEEGTSIGLHEGVVHEIKEDEIIIRERLVDPESEKEFKSITKKLVQDK